jgi:hypothetical protein
VSSTPALGGMSDDVIFQAGCCLGTRASTPIVSSALSTECVWLLHPFPANHARQLKHTRMVNAAMARHGLKSLTKAKARRLAEAAEEEAEEALAVQAARANVNESAVAPDQLSGEGAMAGATTLEAQHVHRVWMV